MASWAGARTSGHVVSVAVHAAVILGLWNALAPGASTVRAPEPVRVSFWRPSLGPKLAAEPTPPRTLPARRPHPAAARAPRRAESRRPPLPESAPIASAAVTAPPAAAEVAGPPAESGAHVPAPAPSGSGADVPAPSPAGSGAGAPGTAASGVLAVAQVARPPAILESPRPRYPAEARARGLGGLVVVRVVLDASGRVEPQHTRVVRSVPGLDEAALQAIARWRFSPAFGHDGRPVRVMVDIPIAFSLR